MKKQIKWLHQELDTWIGEGLVTPDQAVAIRARYPEKGLPWGTLIFSGLGGVIIGLGVILLFAYNWQEIPKFAKLAIVFAALAAIHAVGVRLFLRSDRWRALGDALCLLGTMFFGAGIWLVAQIYNIQEHYPNGLFIWALGALALAWALPSILQAILASILLVVWCGTEAVGFGRTMHLGALLILVLLGPLAYRERSRVLAVILVPSFILSLVFVFSGFDANAGVVVAAVLSVGALLIAAGILVRQTREFPQSAASFLFFGWISYLLTLYLLTFPDLTRHLLERGTIRLPLGVLAYWLGALLLGLTAWSVVAYRSYILKQDQDVTPDQFLIPLTLLLPPSFFLSQAGFEGWLMAAPFNMVFLAIAISMMTRGCRQGLLQPTVLGSILLAILTLTRYVDLFQSLLARGLVFIVMGVAIFIEGTLYSRAKQQKVIKDSSLAPGK